MLSTNVALVLTEAIRYSTMAEVIDLTTSDDENNLQEHRTSLPQSSQIQTQIQSNHGLFLGSRAGTRPSQLTFDAHASLHDNRPRLASRPLQNAGYGNRRKHKFSQPQQDHLPALTNVERPSKRRKTGAGISQSRPLQPQPRTLQPRASQIRTSQPEMIDLEAVGGIQFFGADQSHDSQLGNANGAHPTNLQRMLRKQIFPHINKALAHYRDDLDESVRKGIGKQVRTVGLVRNDIQLTLHLGCN